jgi:Winged helix-turn helix
MIDSAPWAARRHPGPRTVPLPLSDAQRADVEMAIRPDKVGRRFAQRGHALLLMADGVGAEDIGRLLGIDPRTARKWRVRFSCGDPVRKLADAPRSGRPPSLSQPQTAPKS